MSDLNFTPTTLTLYATKNVYSNVREALKVAGEDNARDHPGASRRSCKVLNWQLQGYPAVE